MSLAYFFAFVGIHLATCAIGTSVIVDSVVQQIAASLSRALPALLFAPASDFFMVAAQEDIGDAKPSVLSRTGVLCMFQQPVAAGK
jgi:hypothetical protein